MRRIRTCFTSYLRNVSRSRSPLSVQHTFDRRGHFARDRRQVTPLLSSAPRAPGEWLIAERLPDTSDLRQADSAVEFNKSNILFQYRFFQHPDEIYIILETS